MSAKRKNSNDENFKFQKVEVFQEKKMRDFPELNNEIKDVITLFGKVERCLEGSKKNVEMNKNYSPNKFHNVKKKKKKKLNNRN